MQLEAGDILVEDVTYDSFFHFGKPVVPYTRLKGAGHGGRGRIGSPSFYLPVCLCVLSIGRGVFVVCDVVFGPYWWC